MLNIDSPTRVVINAANVTVEIPISRLTIREYAKRTGETPTAVAHQIDDGCSLPNRQLRKLYRDMLVGSVGSLPNRQLRKGVQSHAVRSTSSLPNRQLRKQPAGRKLLPLSSLPNRQLRKEISDDGTLDASSLPNRQLRKLGQLSVE